MTENQPDPRDPVLWRLQQAFWREEPTTDLETVVRRARTAQALTEDDLAAARRREPTAIARIFRAYAPELFEGLTARSGLAGSSPLNRLSPRERAVLRMMAEGRTRREIGTELLISPHTVRTHQENILMKLQMQSKLEAVAFAIDQGWLDDAGAEPVDRWVERLDGTEMLAKVRDLPPDQRDVLVLRMLGGLTAAEVAEVLGTTTGAVKALQHRGLANLSRVLGLQEPRRPSDPSISRGEGPTGAEPGSPRSASGGGPGRGASRPGGPRP